jgi:hypothetical protein
MCNVELTVISDHSSITGGHAWWGLKQCTIISADTRRAGNPGQSESSRLLNIYLRRKRKSQRGI